MLVRVAAFMREAVAPQGRDDFKAANEAVKRIGNGAEDMDKHAYREWPLFKELRKSPEFAALFGQVFGERRPPLRGGCMTQKLCEKARWLRSAVAQLESEVQHGLAAKAVCFIGAFLPD
jgi:hypothetical protein